MQPPAQKPLLVYDGDCGFCRMWIARFQARTGDRVDYEPCQTAAERLPHIPREHFMQAVQLIEPDGAVSAAAKAVVRTLAYAPEGGKSSWVYDHVPAAAPLMELGYRFVARHRGPLSWLTRLLWGDHIEPASFVLSRWLFLRLLGVAYLIAFLSLGSQVHGLAGSNGILPADKFLQHVVAATGGEAWDRVPTIYWLWPTDTCLDLLSYGGAALSALLILGVAPLPVLVLLWALYLSLAAIGGDFLSFQWDALLLETGLVAVLLAPATLLSRPSKERRPSRPALFVVRLLLFKLMFLSGVVKLTCGDKCWTDLTALNYHYLTQPIPTWTSWYVHQLPAWFQKLSIAVALAIEIGVPFFIFAPRRPRHLACAALVLLQLLIAATGNYGFFNLLTVVLCVPLLDDHWLRRFAPAKWRGPMTAGRARHETPIRRIIIAPIAAAIALLSAAIIIDEIPALEPVAKWAAPVVYPVRVAIGPFRSLNSYGLFRVMTRTRPEIVIEGSRDGVEWKAYEFPYKPGDMMRPPPIIGPHMPRLDWQMWFAALQVQRQPYWFGQFLMRLLQGSPEVLALIETNPFPDAPPKYIRAVYYEYTFTTADERRATGAWWKRTRLEPLYMPPISLRNFTGK